MFLQHPHTMDSPLHFYTNVPQQQIIIKDKNRIIFFIPGGIISLGIFDFTIHRWLNTNGALLFCSDTAMETTTHTVPKCACHNKNRRLKLTISILYNFRSRKRHSNRRVKKKIKIAQKE